ncbi:MAG: hypothetical protein IPO22_13845 [Anaerolineales bacterium]|nr:hypothetical protein [Anaerolineales bacterium]
MVHGKLASLHPLRWLALLAWFLCFFLVGWWSAQKIGGGGDLHNMDAFLVILALIATSFFFQGALRGW